MKQSAGILIYRRNDNKVEVFLEHPGGPFWAKKDDGAWSIPKGEYTEGEDPLEAAKREFREEIGQEAPEGDYKELGQVKASNKLITAWAIEKDLGKVEVVSNTFSLEWPPRSGKKIEVPEVDRAEWYDLTTALRKVYKVQKEFLHRLAEMLGVQLQEADPGASIDSKPGNQQISLL